MHVRTRLAALAALSISTLAPFAPARAQQAEHAFLFVIDGLRASEGFGDPQHQYVGSMWYELAPQGSLLTFVENRAITETLPAHQLFATGVHSQYGQLGFDPTRQYLRPHAPTIFELYRDQTGAPEESCWVISNAVHLYDLEHSLHPAYGESLGATLDVFSQGNGMDTWVWEEIDTVFDQHEVDLMMVNLKETDRSADNEIWFGYTLKATEASDAITAFWAWLQASPIYADNTVLMVTTDHGRHLDHVGPGWVAHGCQCLGCRNTFLLALGPGIREGLVSGMVATQADITATLAHLMGITVPHADGRVLTEILEDGDQVDRGPGGETVPVLASASGLVARAAESHDPTLDDDAGGHAVRFEVSADGGESWTDLSPDRGEVVRRSPMAWTDGAAALFGAFEFVPHQERWEAVVWRYDADTAQIDEVHREDVNDDHTPRASMAVAADGERLVLVEGTPTRDAARFWISEDAGQSWWEDAVVVDTEPRHFPLSTRQAVVGDSWIHTFSAHIARESPDGGHDNTEIYVYRSEDGGESWEGDIAVSDDDRPSVQPVLAVTPDGVLHVIWADLADGTFQLYHASSSDEGASYGEPTKLTDAALGAWQPAAAVDGEHVYLAWSEVDDTQGASIRMARLVDGALEDERAVGDGGRLATHPAIAALGDGRALVSWSEASFGGAWELMAAAETAAGLPATSASGAVDPQVVPPGVGATLTFTVTLTIDTLDRGVDRVALEPAEGFAFTGDAAWTVDGTVVASAASLDGATLWIEADEPVVDDGAVLVLEVPVDTPTAAAPAAGFAATLYHRDEPYGLPVDGALAVATDETIGDDDDDDDCSCELAAGRPAPGGAVLLATLAAAVLGRRLRGGRR